MQKNNKNTGHAIPLKWDNSIVQLWFMYSRNELLSKSERELYFWLATNRFDIHKIKIRSGKSVYRFY